MSQLKFSQIVDFYNSFKLFSKNLPEGETSVQNEIFNLEEFLRILKVFNPHQFSKEVLLGEDWSKNNKKKTKEEIQKEIKEKERKIVSEMISEVEENEETLDQKIDFAEYLSIVTTANDMKRTFKELYKVIDTDESNQVDEEELLKFVKLLGFKENSFKAGKLEEIVHEMLVVLDTNGDGLINFTEFETNLKKLE